MTIIKSKWISVFEVPTLPYLIKEANEVVQKAQEKAQE